MSNRSRLAQHEANQTKLSSIEADLHELRSCEPGTQRWFELVDVAAKAALRAEARRLTEIVGA
jgi:hypothetical protein